ncbi:MAG: hypothetical protein Q8M09_20410 [Pseudomonadota bacterium]|nr:hypothetical protein [Pseudomonadota bacterium]MDP1572700.1 hypothetical protein [Pseudomonadota bacterium]MDP1906572.1 hypothetical protein [Pseudomonadota bacterium]
MKLRINWRRAEQSRKPKENRHLDESGGGDEGAVRSTARPSRLSGGHRQTGAAGVAAAEAVGLCQIHDLSLKA